MSIPYSNHPAGTSDSDSHFNLPSVGDDPEMVEVEIPCESCVKGMIEVCETRVTNFFDPFNYVEVTCPDCKGSEFVMVERCEACDRAAEECKCLDGRESQ